MTVILIADTYNLNRQRKEMSMQIKDLIKTLQKHNLNNEVVFYNLDNDDLRQKEYLETILNADGQCEITTTLDKEMANV